MAMDDGSDSDDKEHVAGGATKAISLLAQYANVSESDPDSDADADSGEKVKEGETPKVEARTTDATVKQ